MNQTSGSTIHETEDEPFVSKTEPIFKRKQSPENELCKIFYVGATTLLSIIFILKIIFANPNSAISPSLSQPRLSVLPRDTKTKVCLFIISTKMEYAPHILNQFQSYDPSRFGLLLNMYDKSDFSSDLPSVTMSYVPGWKSSLWVTITVDKVEGYDYVWFMDDDLVFSKKVFPFDQFHHVVKTMDAIISSPKVYRPSKKAKFQYSEGKMKPQEIVGSQFTADVGVIEIQSFMFKTAAWVYFHDEMLLDIKDIDWGPDCFWCGMFRVESQFGNYSCIKTSYYGMTHLDRQSLDHNLNADKKYLDRGKAAQKKYKQQIKKKYKGKIRFECDHHRTLAYIPYTHQFIELEN